MTLAWPLYFTLAVFAPLLLKVFKPQYASGASSLELLAVAMLVATAIGPVDIVLLMGGRSMWNLFNVVVALGLNLALSFLLIPQIGIAGAACAWAASILFNNIAPLAEIRAFLKLHPFGRGFPVVSTSAALCFGVFGMAIRLSVGLSIPSFAVYLVVATRRVRRAHVAVPGPGRARAPGRHASCQAPRPRAARYGVDRRAFSSCIASAVGVPVPWRRPKPPPRARFQRVHETPSLSNRSSIWRWYSSAPGTPVWMPHSPMRSGIRHWTCLRSGTESTAACDAAVPAYRVGLLVVGRGPARRPVVAVRREPDAGDAVEVVVVVERQVVERAERLQVGRADALAAAAAHDEHRPAGVDRADHPADLGLPLEHRVGGRLWSRPARPGAAR